MRSGITALLLIVFTGVATFTPHSAVAGGATPMWTAQMSGSTATLNDVSCATPLMCFAVGNNATVLKTGNGGKKWSTVSTVYGTAHPTAAFVSIRCPAPSVCSLVAAPNVVLRTVNGGYTWQSHVLALPSTLTGLTRIACPTRNVCFAIAPPSGDTMSWFNHSGAAFKTSDGNKTWHSSPIPPTVICPGDCNQRPVGYALQWISCQSAQSCRAGGDTFIGSHEGYSSAIVRTDNGGTSWTLVSSDIDANIGTCPTTSICTGIYYLPQSPGYGPDLMRSTNGGSTWSRKSIKPVVTSIACTGKYFCELAGPAGTLAMTINTKVFVQKSPTTQDLNAVACPRMNACFAVGAHGTIVART